MKPIPADFWHQPTSSDLGLPLPSLTEADLQAAEARLGVRLPAALIRLLRTQNGGYPNYCEYPMYRPPESADDYIEVREIYGLSAEASRGLVLSNYEVDFQITDETGRRLDDAMETWRKKLGNEKLIIPFSGGGHSYIALDYRGVGPKGEPAVILMDVEGDEFEFEELAASFEEFLDTLEKPSRR
jgi:hypothetical protein